MESKRLPLSLVDINQGQVDGLPRNPRTWTFGDIEKLKKSINETPELLEARGLLVYPYNGRYVCIGGNMRLSALSSMGVESAPCMIVPEGTPVDKLIELVIKDNGTFGDWDEALLKKDWSDVPLVEWGIDVFESDMDQNVATESVSLDDDRKVLEVAFETQEFEFVRDRLRNINDVPEQALLKLLGYGEE